MPSCWLLLLRHWLRIDGACGGRGVETPTATATSMIQHGLLLLLLLLLPLH